jgi:molybdate transport system substrate-binding protein
MIISGNSRILGGIILACSIILLNSCGKKRENKPVTLKLYAGAGLQRGVKALTEAFQSAAGIKVEADYGGSGMIISRAREDTSADLFMPGDAWYAARLQELSGLIYYQEEIAYFVPVIITAKGNPKGIRSLRDFLRSDVRPAFGNPKSCQIGKITLKIFKKNGIDISKRPPYRESLTVNELGLWVKMNAADASIVWDATAANFAEDTDIVRITPEENIISRAVAAVLKSSSHKKEAEEFVRFITSPEGRSILKSRGYTTELKHLSVTDKSEDKNESGK